MSLGPEEAGAEALVAEERRRAIRLLLARPFVTDTRPDPETFALVRRHARDLQRWFAEQLGYRLVVDTELARLHKRAAPGARARPLRTASGLPFDARRYALFCLVLAALERMEVQTVLSELAAQVTLLAASEEAVERFELESYAERQAFVDAVRQLVELGVLTLADGEDSAFVEGRGDALYDIHGRRLSQLLSVPVPATAPRQEADFEALAADFYPDTEEGANRRLRHRLLRRLVEEPVLHVDELEEAERLYLQSQRHYLLGQVAAHTGLAVEVRREGLVAVDPAGRLSDLQFPGTGTVSHAALLLGEILAERARAAPERAVVVPLSELAEALAALLARYGHLWSKRYREDPAGADRLLADALERLEAMGLAVRRPGGSGGSGELGGIEPRPALARYRPLAPPVRGEYVHE